jgi:hypothetical protein
MKPTKAEVAQWLQNPNAITGMDLLHRINPMAKPINIRAIMAKLCFHTGIPIPNQLPVNSEQLTGNSEQKSEIENQKSEIPNSESQETHQQINESTNQQSEILNHKSKIAIEQIIKEHSHLFQLRSQLGQQRTDLGNGNDPQTVKQRKVLSESIQQHSERIEALFNAKEDFYTKGIIPNMEALFPNQQINESTNQQINESTNQQSQILNLKSQLKNLNTALLRDENQIKYQTSTKQKKANPMPDGPKKNKILNRIAERKIEISKISDQIQNLK